jgi:hypothetical protein
MPSGRAGARGAWWRGSKECHELERPGIQKGEFLLATFLSKRKVAFCYYFKRFHAKIAEETAKGAKVVYIRI